MPKIIKRSVAEHLQMKAMAKSERIRPCEDCGRNLWKTKVKGMSYQCRHCQLIRIETNK